MKKPWEIVPHTLYIFIPLHTKHALRFFKISYFGPGTILNGESTVAPLKSRCFNETKENWIVLSDSSLLCKAEERDITVNTPSWVIGLHSSFHTLVSLLTTLTILVFDFSRLSSYFSDCSIHLIMELIATEFEYVESFLIPDFIRY